MTEGSENLRNDPFLDKELDWTEKDLARLRRLKEAPKDQTPPIPHVTAPSLSEYIEELRKKGQVPVGVIAYDVAAERLHLLLFPDIRDMEEANALLAQIGVRGTP
ncbi:MAG TPA: hypothetical protein VIX91_10900 [Candidatus Acidoferrum sp.]